MFSFSENLDPLPSTSKKRKTNGQDYLMEYAKERKESEKQLRELIERMIKKREERALRKEELQTKKIESLINSLKK